MQDMHIISKKVIHNLLEKWTKSTIFDRQTHVLQTKKQKSYPQNTNFCGIFLIS